MSNVLKTVLVFCGLLASVGTVGAQATDGFPNRPIEMIYPYPPGSGAGNFARAFAAEAGKEMGQPWIVLNREGAAGVLGITSLARAKPDGYTVSFSAATPMTSSRFVNSNVPFTNDQIEPLCEVFQNVFAIAVRRDSPIRNLEDLIARAKAAPGAIAYGHAGRVSPAHLGVARLEQAANIKLNTIPYRGDIPLLTDLMGGAVSFGAIGVNTIMGKDVRVLAVLSSKRHPALPDVPSVAELGYPAITQGIFGLFLPAGTPRPIFNRYADVCQKVAASPAIEALARNTFQVMSYADAKEFKSLLDATIKEYTAIVPSLDLDKN
ncbi:tripartite tricarboxylate transporter substrate binding protein [Variovorax paradoxus]|nr:tripartite tricarboxylate transporter substrate binding protein [Variovorax paradoxus]MBT2305193.1 tripartite tricarboxylate transporter substrate binding protein [Variovorax paradoxus]